MEDRRERPESAQRLMRFGFRLLTHRKLAKNLVEFGNEQFAQRLTFRRLYERSQMSRLLRNFLDFVQQHGFAHATQAEQHLRSAWLADQRPLNRDLSILENGFASGKLWRAATGTRRKRISNRVHGRSQS